MSNKNIKIKKRMGKNKWNQLNGYDSLIVQEQNGYRTRRSVTVINRLKVIIL